MQSKIEKDNFARFAQGIVGTGTTMARDMLTSFIPCTLLATKVQSLPLWSRLTTHQKVLVNLASVDGYKKFDLTLIYTLLRNVCTNLHDPGMPNLAPPTQGWGKDPMPCDISPSDDIERIRCLRNTVYAHVAEASLSDTEYKTHWWELKYICTRMRSYLGKDYLKELQELENYNVSEMEIKDLITSLISMKAENENLHSEIKRLVQSICHKNRQEKSTGFPEHEINRLRDVLYKNNLLLTQKVPVSPLQNLNQTLPIDQLYTPVTIREDLEMKQKGDNPWHRTSERTSKLVNSPRDLFYKHGELARYIFMQGDAAFGKSVFCLQLVRDWCRAKECEGIETTLSEWEKGLGEFDFVFPVLLRHVNKKRSLLTDMICYDMFKHNYECHKAIRHVLSNSSYRCLIVIDGLDEWKPSNKARSCLTHVGLPNTEKMSSCLLFFTTRPWKFNEIRGVVDKNDRVVEIHGIDENGVKQVIRNVLVNCYAMEEDSQEFKMLFQRMLEKSKCVTLKSIMKIPLLVTVSVPLWIDDRRVGESLTSFYMALLRLLIRRTYNADLSYETTLDKLTRNLVPNMFLVNTSLFNKTVKDFISVLCVLGEVAYQDIVSQETHLVFEKDELALKIGHEQLKFALKVGLLSQSVLPGSFVFEEVSVNFFHKTVQELLTALYISCTNKVSVEAFCDLLSNMTEVMNLSNVIIFLSGISVQLGHYILRHIVKVANSDADILRYRETFRGDAHEKVRLFYELQMNCCREMKQALTTKGDENTLTYDIPDVYLECWTLNLKSVRERVELLCQQHRNFVSLHIWSLHDSKEYGITDDELAELLDNATTLKYLYISYRYLFKVSARFSALRTLYLENIIANEDFLEGLQISIQSSTDLRTLVLYNITYINNGERKSAPLSGVLLSLTNPQSLSTLYISDLGRTEDIRTLVDVLPQLKNLVSVQYYGKTYRNVELHAAVALTTSSMKLLQTLRLHDIVMGDKLLAFTQDMTQLENLELSEIKMAPEGWGKFLQSIVSLPQKLDISLKFTNIDDGTLAVIRSSSCITITRDERNDYGNTWLTFKKVT